MTEVKVITTCQRCLLLADWGISVDFLWGKNQNVWRKHSGPTGWSYTMSLVWLYWESYQEIYKVSRAIAQFFGFLSGKQSFQSGNQRQHKSWGKWTVGPFKSSITVWVSSFFATIADDQYNKQGLHSNAQEPDGTLKQKNMSYPWI